MAILFSIFVSIVILGWLWFYIVRPILEDYHVIAPRAVNSFRDAAPVMSSEYAQTAPQTQTDRQTDLVSEADLWLDRIEVDRTKTALIELLVYSGWDVGQIRSVVKGDNGAIGIEVEAARKRLGIVIEPRQLRVRDDQGERMISMDA